MRRKIRTDSDNLASYYFNEIGKYKPLSREEEYSLWERYKKQNDIGARDKLIKSNLKFVANIAKSYQGMGLSYADLIAEGNCGLMKAIDKFDYKRGYKTISYSVWWIRQTIMEALSQRAEINGETLPDDSDKEVEEESLLNSDKLDIGDEYTDKSYYKAISDGEMKGMVSFLMDVLSDREKNIISKYFGIESKKEMTLEEIGKEMGLTKERVRQIKESAMKKLRSAALSHSLSIESR